MKEQQQKLLPKRGRVLTQAALRAEEEEGGGGERSSNSLVPVWMSTCSRLRVKPSVRIRVACLGLRTKLFLPTKALDADFPVVHSSSCAFASFQSLQPVSHKSL